MLGEASMAMGRDECRDLVLFKEMKITNSAQWYIRPVSPQYLNNTKEGAERV